MSWMSRAGGRDVAVAKRDCGISTKSQTRPICKRRFSVLSINKTDLNLRPNWGEFVSDLGIGWLFGRVNKVT